MAKGNPNPVPRTGKPNKATAEIKDMILGALSDAGGRGYLLIQAYENPVAFMGLLGKILPKDINATVKADFIVYLNEKDKQL